MTELDPTALAKVKASPYRKYTIGALIPDDAIENIILVYLAAQPPQDGQSEEPPKLTGGELWEFLFSDLKGDVPKALTDDLLERLALHIRTHFIEAPSETVKELAKGKDLPISIWHKGDAEAYYQATEEERAAWNAYAQSAADAFDNDPRRDSYDSTRVFSGHDRDGRVTNWCPPLYFPEWLERRRALTKDTGIAADVVLVPQWPTDAMREAGLGPLLYGTDGMVIAVYRAMILAAPTIKADHATAAVLPWNVSGSTGFSAITPRGTYRAWTDIAGVAFYTVPNGRARQAADIQHAKAAAENHHRAFLAADPKDPT